jgi:hypothetical protein
LVICTRPRVEFSGIGNLFVLRRTLMDKSLTFNLLCPAALCLGLWQSVPSSRRSLTSSYGYAQTTAVNDARLQLAIQISVAGTRELLREFLL